MTKPPLGLLALLALSGPALARADAVWVIDTLDATLNASAYSLAIDSTDRLHVSFQEGSTKKLHYGTFVSGAWVTEEVSDSGFFNCLAVTGTGEPAIAFSFNRRLYCASRSGDDWVVELADPTHITSWRFVPAIGIGPDGQKHIVAYDTGTSIYYCTDGSGAWTSERMNPGHGDDAAAIAIAEDGTPWTAYPELCCYSEQHKLYLAERSETEWVRSIADSTPPYFHSGIHLALGPDGRPRIADRRTWFWIDSCDYAIQYLRQTENGTWLRQVIDGIGHDPMFDANYIGTVDLALDRNGDPHILYREHIDVFDSGEDPQDFFYHAFQVGGAWTIEAMPVRGNGIVIDSRNVPCVLFTLPAPANGLYLARRVDATGVAGGPREARGLRLAVSPNPMRGGGTISFVLDGEGAARGGAAGVAPSSPAAISIYDIRGRAMRSFETAAPFGALTWDGADGAGRALAPGVYFIRLNDGERRATARVTIVR